MRFSITDIDGSYEHEDGDTEDGDLEDDCHPTHESSALALCNDITTEALQLWDSKMHWVRLSFMSLLKYQTTP